MTKSRHIQIEEVARRRRARNVTILIFKLAVSIALIMYLAERAEPEQMRTHIVMANPIWLAGALALMLLQYPLAGQRWRMILARLDFDISPVTAQNFIWVGQLFNQVLPGFIAGDVIRLWYASGLGLSLRHGLGSLIWDRAIGAVGLAMITASFAPGFFVLLSNDTAGWIVVLTALGCVAGFLGLVIAGGWLPTGLAAGVVAQVIELMQFGWRIFGNLWTLTATLALAAGTNLIASFAAFLVGASFHVAVPVELCLMTIPIALFLTLVPISIAGWGVREGILVYLLGFAGIPASDALLLSVGFGLVSWVAALPGLILWLTLKRPRLASRSR